MTIRCYGCGKVFEVRLLSDDLHEFPCPACGKVEVFDLGALKQRVTEIIRKKGNRP